jgi:hypothetical protein
MPQGDPLSYIQNAAEQVFRGIASTPDPQITSQLAKVLNDLTSIQEKVMATSGGAGTARGGPPASAAAEGAAGAATGGPLPPEAPAQDPSALMAQMMLQSQGA